MPRRVERVERILARGRQAREDRLARIGRAKGIEQRTRECRLVVRRHDLLHQRLDYLSGRGLWLLLLLLLLLSRRRGLLASRSSAWGSGRCGIGGLRARGARCRC